MVSKGLDHGGSWVQIPSGTRIFSESLFLPYSHLYLVVVVCPLVH